MKDGEAPNVFADAQLNLARHNLQVEFKKILEKAFVGAKKTATESAEGAKKLDDFVRKYYSSQPRKMAEWEEIMAKWEFMDDEIDDTK